MKKKQKSEFKDELETLNERINELSKKQKPTPPKVEPKNVEESKRVVVEKSSLTDFFSAKKEEKREALVQAGVRFSSWKFPDSDLLNKSQKKHEIDTNLVEKQSLEIKKTLLQFRLEVEMKGYTVGPTVIQYRLKPAE